MKHLGDITKISGYKIPPVDIITGGSPCQDLSVAGNRAGLSGERSGLFMEQIRIIKEMRENEKRSGRANEFIRPRYMVWENVPGAFSSNKGEDFRAVLEETAKVADSNAIIPRLETKNGRQKWSKSGCILGDGWSIAWRLHDAQFWGVPQRRKRIALVADFGGDTAPKILFEREGVSGDITESGEEGQRTTGNAEGGTGKAISFQERAGKPGGGKGILIQDERIGALSTLNNQSVCVFEPGAASRLGGYCWENIAGTLRANAGDNQQAVVCGSAGFDGNMGAKAGNIGYQEEKSPTLNAGKQMTVVVEGNGSRPSHKGDGYAESETMYTLNGTEHHAVAYRKTSHAKSAEDGQGWAETEVNDTLNAFDSGETRTPTVIVDNKKTVYDWHRCDTRMTELGDTCNTMSASWGAGGNNMPYVVESMEVFHCTSEEEKVQTLKARDYKDPQVVAYGLDRTSFNQGENAKFGFSVDKEMVGAQTARGPGAVCEGLGWNSIVRRLTPLECERLQGFPDGWTDIGDWIDHRGRKRKGSADSPRYKALGNSIALPFWQWLAERMVKWLPDSPTMGSLFDGIGGFPLVYSRVGCEPIWASEIEDFPIAVTKKRFPDVERRKNDEAD